MRTPLAVRVLEDLRAAFVGRQTHTRWLLDEFDRVRTTGSLSFLTVTGKPGIGKSRLAEEFAVSLAATFPDARTFRGTSVGLGAPPYLSIERILEARFGLCEEEPPKLARAKIMAGVREVVAASQVVETVHLLAKLMRRPFSESPFIPAATATDSRLETRCYLALRRFLEADAQAQPLVLVFDEMDHAPAETIRILHYLAEGLAEQPVLLLALGRDELFGKHSSWSHGDYRRDSLTLEPLTPDESHALAKALSGNTPLPDWLVEHVRNRLGGNPRAIEETIRYLIELEIAQRSETGDLIFSRERPTVELPNSVEQILEFRLRALPDSERELAKMAAATGECFWLDAVVALVRAKAPLHDLPDGPSLAELGNATDRSRNTVADGLRRLAARGLIQERRITRQIPGEREYRFLGPVQALAYGLLSEEDRRQFHRTLAQWHELRSGRGVEETQRDVARHLEQAGELGLAARRYQEAAEIARQRYANEQAIDLYQRALECAGTDGALRIQLWHDLGSVYELVGDYEKALDAFERLLRLSWLLVSRSKGGVALNKMGRLWRRRGNLARALEYFSRGLELFQQSNDERGVAASLDDIGWVKWLDGRYDHALEAATRGLEIRRELGDRRSIAQSLTNLGNIQKDRGLLIEAEAHHREALRHRRDVGDRYGVALSLNYLGVLAQAKGDSPAALALLDDALRESEAIGAIPLQAMLLTNLGEIALETGQYGPARQSLEQAIAIGRELATQRVLSAAHRSFGIVELKLGNRKAAKESCETALHIAEQAGIRELAGRALLALGEVEAATLFDTSGAHHAEQAQEYMTRAVTLFREMGNDFDLARALKRLGQLDVEHGRETLGTERLAEAQAILDQLGVGSEDVRAILREISLSTA